MPLPPANRMTAAQKAKRNQKSIASRRKNGYWKSAEYKTAQQLWRRNNFVLIALRAAKVRAIKNGLPFNLNPEDVRVPTHCPILGIPLIRGKGMISDNSPSLDRKIPTRGYVRGNVVVISYRANRLKSNCTDPAELRAVAAYIEGCLTDP